MSKADEWLAIYQQHAALLEWAATEMHALTDVERTDLQSALAELERLAPYLGCKVEFIDPNIAGAEKALAVFDAHYRRKVELDRKLFDDSQ